MSVTTADVVVVGAGPAGSAAAYFLAEAGRDVVLMEKDAFPRDKVCGDALTPRAVKALHALGLSEEAAGTPPGWRRQDGLRMHGGGVVIDLPWPQLDDWPAHSVTATRALFDHTLAKHAVKAGAQLWEETEVTGPVWLSSSQQRLAGVTYRAGGRPPEPPGRSGSDREGTIRAPVVIVADGNSSRLSVGLGLHRLPTRPMGVAVRTYHTSPRSAANVMDGFLEIRTGDELLPGYGWVFPLDGGQVNVGWGLLNSSAHFRSVNYRHLLDRWIATLPPEWEITPGTRTAPPRSAGLPMAHNRKPAAYRGALLVGDAAGMVNPFNGEGISYAIEAAAFAAEAADAALRTRSDAPLARYPRAVAEAWGGYYTLGRVFVRLMGHPEVMRFCTVYGMPRLPLMRFVFRTMAHLVNRRSTDVTDRVLNALARAVPAA